MCSSDLSPVSHSQSDGAKQATHHLNRVITPGTQETQTRDMRGMIMFDTEAWDTNDAGSSNDRP